MVSTGLAHPPLVDEATFVAAQQISALDRPHDERPRRYLLTGLVVCAVCDRRAEAQWAHGRAAYRCRHGIRGARRADAPRPVYTREDTLIAAAAVRLDGRTGQGQSLWESRDVASYLRANELTLRCTHDMITVDGNTELPMDNGIDTAHNITPMTDRRARKKSAISERKTILEKGKPRRHLTRRTINA